MFINICVSNVYRSSQILVVGLLSLSHYILNDYQFVWFYILGSYVYKTGLLCNFRISIICEK